MRLRNPPCPCTFTMTPCSPVFKSDSFIVFSNFTLQSYKIIFYYSTLQFQIPKKGWDYSHYNYSYYSYFFRYFSAKQNFYYIYNNI